MSPGQWDTHQEIVEGPTNTDGPVHHVPAVGDQMQVYREIAQAVIASAALDLVNGRTRAEEAHQFLCGAGDDNRMMLKFWCLVAGYAPHQVMTTTRARSVCAWPVWWRAHGKLRLKQIQDRLARVRSGYVSVSASGALATEEERDGWWPVLLTGGFNGES